MSVEVCNNCRTLVISLLTKTDLSKLGLKHLPLGENGCVLSSFHTESPSLICVNNTFEGNAREILLW